MLTTTVSSSIVSLGWFSKGYDAYQRHTLLLVAAIGY